MDILFWSGGKDSYLALELFSQEADHKLDLSLLTTYDEETDIVPHQQIPLERIRQQAEQLDLPLIEIPLPSHCSNKTYLSRIKRALDRLDQSVERLIFGDWHLQDIRKWREEMFREMGYECCFPIWGKSLHELLPILLLKPIQIKVSAVKEEFREYIKTGEVYNQTFIRTLPEEIDPMGENGEFHTEVMFEDLSKHIV